jgi:hypothetical protein
MMADNTPAVPVTTGTITTDSGPIAYPSGAVRQPVCDFILQRAEESLSTETERKFNAAYIRCNNGFDVLAQHLAPDFGDRYNFKLSFSDQLLKDGSSALTNVRERYFDLMNDELQNPSEHTPLWVLTRLRDIEEAIDKAKATIKAEADRACSILTHLSHEHRAFMSSQVNFLGSFGEGSNDGNELPLERRKRSRNWDTATDCNRKLHRGDRFHE